MIPPSLAVLLLAGPLVADLPRSFLVLHTEPDSADALHHAALVDLVAQAEARNVLATIELCPQWAAMILADPAKQAQVAVWRAVGHEIGAHHHDYFGPLVWDGYTDLDPALVAGASQPYLGTMGDLVAAIEPLAGPAGVRTLGGSGSGYEWPFGVRHRTGVPGSGPSATPVAEVVNRYRVHTLDHDPVVLPAHVAGLIAQHAAAGEDELVGAVLHPYNYMANPGPVLAWMDHLASVDPGGNRNVTVSEALDPLPDALVVEPAAIQAAVGGALSVEVRSASSHASDGYGVFLSLAGDTPGLEAGGAWNDAVHVALVPDGSTWSLWSLAGGPGFPGFAGNLAPDGSALASTLIPPLPPALVGQRLSLACVAWDASGLTFSSNGDSVVFQ